MFNILDELQIGMAAKEMQDRSLREEGVRRRLNEAQLRERASPIGWASWAQFLALALRTFGINGRLSWKL